MICNLKQEAGIYFWELKRKTIIMNTNELKGVKGLMKSPGYVKPCQLLIVNCQLSLSHCFRPGGLRFARIANCLLLIAFSSLLIFSSCNQQPKKDSKTVVASDKYYTCSMHPNIRQDHPGTCPVCGMKLIAVSKSSKKMGNTMQIHLTPEQIRLGNIQADSVGKSNIGNKLEVTGTLNFNEDKLTSQSARVEGRIDQLYFKNIGDFVKRGDKIYDLYSEQLNNAKQEYINALQQMGSMENQLINYAALVESAKTKLLLWGMTASQIQQLAKNRKVNEHTVFYSNASGYITTLNVIEGDYVMEGGTVLQLANLSTLWAEAQVYNTQMPLVRKGVQATVRIPDMGNQLFKGKIDFINPETDPDQRIDLVRVTIPNKNNHLHPGMPVYITISGGQHHALLLPAVAVLREGGGARVWVQTQPGVYEMRKVTTGIEEGGNIEITSGLSLDDVVVTHGAYLVNSEYVFKHGADPMAGMKM